LGDHPNVYEAGIWQSAFRALLTGAFALCIVWSWDDLPYVLHELGVLQLWVCVALASALALSLLALCIWNVFLVFRPAVVTVGDEGIEAQSLLGPSRALWRDFAHFTQHSGEDGDSVSLHFRQRSGGSGRPLVVALGAYPGLNGELVVQDARVRLRQVGISPAWRD